MKTDFFNGFFHHLTDLSLTQRLCEDPASASPGRFQDPHPLEPGFQQPLCRCHPRHPAAYDHNPTVCLRHQSSHSATLKLAQSGHWPIFFPRSPTNRHVPLNFTLFKRLLAAACGTTSQRPARRHWFWTEKILSSRQKPVLHFTSTTVLHLWNSKYILHRRKKISFIQCLYLCG